jgi:phospholipid/cholesterol/gamma-HCH transport system substrate-binding protein
MTGLVTLVFGASVAVFGVMVGAGKLASKYHISATFSAAGQGLLPGSDVKVHGINVGSVTSVHLDHGRAKVGMAIHQDEKLPVASSATIRPKTLFGEKFVDVDPGASEGSGPFLKDHGVITQTVGGFELETVLTDLYPILKAVNPDELASLLDTLSQAGVGEGPAINRQLGNFQKVADVSAAHAADTQQFLDDLAKLSDELAVRAPDVVAGAQDLNVALPDLNAHAQDLTTVLEQGSRLATDLADVLEANRPFLNKSVTEGGKTIQLLFDKRGQLPGVVRGLTEFFQVLAEVGGRIPDPTPGATPGSTLSAVKLVLGGGPPCGMGLSCLPGGPASAPASPPAPTTNAVPAAPATVPVAVNGVEAIRQLVGGLLR